MEELKTIENKMTILETVRKARDEEETVTISRRTLQKLVLSHAKIMKVLIIDRCKEISEMGEVNYYGEYSNGEEELNELYDELATCEREIKYYERIL
jgi:hypothetical protein